MTSFDLTNFQKQQKKKKQALPEKVFYWICANPWSYEISQRTDKALSNILYNNILVFFVCFFLAKSRANEKI